MLCSSGYGSAGSARRGDGGVADESVWRCVLGGQAVSAKVVSRVRRGSADTNGIGVCVRIQRRSVSGGQLGREKRQGAAWAKSKVPVQ